MSLLTIHMPIPLTTAEDLRAFFQSVQFKKESQSKTEEEQEDEDLEQYHVEIYDNWNRGLVEKHVYKPSTLQAVKVCYDNAGEITGDDLREFN